MKQIKYISLVLLLGIANTISAIPYYSIRSQSEDSARELVGLAHQINLYDIGTLYGTFAITPEYTQSFRSCDIAECLFGRDLQCNCDCPTLGISGSRVSDRCPRDWLADYFGLPTDFQSQITFDPQVRNFIVDFQLYLGLDDWLEGLYFRIHAPAVHTRWKLDYCETICDSGTQNYDEGYFAPQEIVRANLLDSFGEYVSQCRTPELTAGTEVIDRVCFLPLHCSRWADCCCRLTETRLSDVQMALGWNFFQGETYHFGLNLRAAAPTGNRPDGQFLFEPIVGNGHHWEFGAGYTTHFVIWESENEDKSFSFYSDGNFTHLFATRQTRCFDLCNSPNSRYMLAEKLCAPVNFLFAVDPTDITVAFEPQAQFRNIFSPVANLTSTDVNVSVGVQIDITAMFNYQSGGFEWDLGYNFWGRTCEKINFGCCPIPFDGNQEWALKGDASVFGFSAAGGNPVAADGAIPLSATQSLATIYTGRNNYINTNPNSGGFIDIRPSRNPGVDNQRFARQGSGVINAPINDRRTTNPLAPGVQMMTSFQPVFLSPENVNICGARTRGISHKIFTHLSYTWWDNEKWFPYIGVGGKAEFAPHDSCDCCGCDPCNPSALCCDELCVTLCDGFCCSGCRKCNLSEWGIWIKGGVAFQ